MEFGYWHILAAILVPGVLWASWIDYAQRRVPNWLNASLIVLGFVAQGIYNGSGGLTAGLCGMLVGFGLLIVPWMMHGMGAGDVKLMAAIGVWVGPALALYCFVAGAVIGGIVAVIMILSTGRFKLACANMSVIMAKCSNRQAWFTEFGSAKSFGATSQLLPYGVPLTAGTLLVLAMKAFGS